MTEKEVKKFLSRARKLDKEILALKMKLLDLQLREQNLISNYSGINIKGSGKNEAGFEKATDKITDLEASIKNRLRELSEIEAEIFEVINQVEDSTLRTILIHRFLNGYGWRKITSLIKYYEYEYVKNGLIKKAIKEVENIMKEKRGV